MQPRRQQQEGPNVGLPTRHLSHVEIPGRSIDNRNHMKKSGEAQMSWRICNNVSVFIGIIKKKLSFGGKYITCCISSNAQLCCLWSPKSYRIEKTERSSNPDLCPGEKASTLEKHHERHVGCRPAPEVNCELTMQSYIKGAMVKTYQNMGFMVYHPSHRNRYTGYITSSLVLDLWPS
jgi:hypothetical protein